jgi:hypothetical protein
LHRGDIRYLVGREIAAADHHFGGLHQLLRGLFGEFEAHDHCADRTVEVRRLRCIEGVRFGAPPEAAG